MQTWPFVAPSPSRMLLSSVHFFTASWQSRPLLATRLVSLTWRLNSESSSVRVSCTVCEVLLSLYSAICVSAYCETLKVAGEFFNWKLSLQRESENPGSHISLKGHRHPNPAVETGTGCYTDYTSKSRAKPRASSFSEFQKLCGSAKNEFLFANMQRHDIAPPSASVCWWLSIVEL